MRKRRVTRKQIELEELTAGTAEVQKKPKDLPDSLTRMLSLCEALLDGSMNSTQLSVVLTDNPASLVTSLLPSDIIQGLIHKTQMPILFSCLREWFKASSKKIDTAFVLYEHVYLFIVGMPL